MTAGWMRRGPFVDVGAGVGGEGAVVNQPSLGPEHDKLVSDRGSRARARLRAPWPPRSAEAPLSPASTLPVTHHRNSLSLPVPSVFIPGPDLRPLLIHLPVNAGCSLHTFLQGEAKEAAGTKIRKGQFLYHHNCGRVVYRKKHCNIQSKIKCISDQLCQGLWLSIKLLPSCQKKSKHNAIHQKVSAD